MNHALTLPRLALRNLARRPGRTLLTVAGVALAVAAFVALIGLARGLETALRTSLETRGTDIVVSERGAVDLVSSLVPEDLARHIARLPEIDAASPELSRLTALPDGASIPVVAWPANSYLWSDLEVVDGALPSDTDGLSVALGRRLAEGLGLGAGDRIELFRAPFTVAGIVDSASLLNRNIAFARLSDVQALTFRAGQATTIHVRLAKEASAGERDAALAAIRERLPDYAVEPADAFSKSNVGARIADALSWSISIVAVAIAIMSVMNTLGMAVNERRREIAVMRAVGWPNRRILISILVEGLALCVLGGVLGSVIGYAGARAIADLPAIRGFFEPSVSLALVAYAMAITLLLGALGSLLPALRAVSVDPAEILRGR